ncbi:olfactory receptor 6F1-like [Microcaecilia unicolor]|uniref:Olfactory receptor n=1 Tax=Microcaecilia unicolor TaxID=1415580 RepID=A0A6P7WN02_9AMPH|nr:olfactory receptor 6F1-like [Microcaecilia unicolor]
MTGRRNGTSIKEFTFLGFPSLRQMHSLVFLIVLIIYIVTVSGNTLIIVVIGRQPHLHTPMYFFLSNLALLEIFYTTNIVPKMLEGFLVEHKYISFIDCMVQLYFFLSMACAENFLLTAMAYDRFVAICKPLHYATIMSNRVCFKLALCSWVLGFLIPIVPVLMVTRVDFCGSNVINHFFCDVSPLIKLSCTDSYQIKLVEFTVASSVLLTSCTIILLSYIYIISAILRIPSVSGRHKAFSTCISHLIIVSIFFGSGILIYIGPTAYQSFDLNKTVSVLYTVITPLFNPFIYTFRNEQVKTAFRNTVRRSILRHRGCCYWLYCKEERPQSMKEKAST